MKNYYIEDRNANIKANVIYMYLYRLGGIVVNFLYVPLLIKSLDVDNYGVWLTLTTVISWMSFFDIGLGSGMRNKVAQSLAENNIIKTKEYISTTYVMMSFIALAIVLVFSAIIPFLDWKGILNAKTIELHQLTALVYWVFTLFVVQLVLKLITSLLYALQKPAQTSFVTFLCQFISLIVVWGMSISPCQFNLLNYGMVISVCPILVLFVYSLFLYRGKYKELAPSFRYFRREKCKEVANVGIQYFLIQLTSIFLFQSNSFILAHVIDSASVVDYNIAYKYLSIPSIAFTIITGPIWSATTDAISRDDYSWVSAVMIKLRRLFFAFSLVVMVLVVISPIAYKLWVGDNLCINWALLISLGFYQILSLRTGYYCAIINGSGKIRLQFIFTFAEALIHLPLAYFLATKYGIVGVVLSLSIMTAINNIWEPIQIDKILKRKAYGIWNK